MGTHNQDGGEKGFDEKISGNLNPHLSISSPLVRIVAMTLVGGVSGSGKRPETLHFQPSPRCCCCFWTIFSVVGCLSVLQGGSLCSKISTCAQSGSLSDYLTEVPYRHPTLCFSFCSQQRDKITVHFFYVNSLNHSNFLSSWSHLESRE